MTHQNKDKFLKYTEFEINLLASLIQKFSSYIHNSNTHKNSLITKRAAWNAIVDEFARNPECHPRSYEKLNEKWKTMKKVM